MHSKTAVLIQSMRPPFLVLTPVCIFLGLAVSYYLHGSFNNALAIITLIAGLAAHISANTFNEYFDFSSGLDLLTKRTPFSGGSGGIPSNPEARTGVLILAILSLLITSAFGLYLVSQTGWLLILPGLLGIVIIVVYTQWINRVPWLCLVTPGFAFGPIFVVGAYICVSDQNLITTRSLLIASMVSLVPFFLVNNLLLLNQIPDISADKKVGRKTFPIVYGLEKSLWVYLVFIGCSALAITTSVLLDAAPWLALFAIVPLAFGLQIYSGIKKTDYLIEKMIPYLGKNVALTLLTPTLLGVLIILS